MFLKQNIFEKADYVFRNIMAYLDLIVQLKSHSLQKIIFPILTPQQINSDFVYLPTKHYNYL